MSPRINVRAFCDPVANHTAVFASLPETYAVDGDGPIDIALVDPTFDSVAVGLNSAPAALVIADAASLSRACATDLAKEHIPAFPALRLSSLLTAVSPGHVLAQASLVRSHLAWQGEWTPGVVEHLVGLETLCGPLEDVRLLSIGEGGYAGRALTNSGVEVLWSGVNNAVFARYELDIIGLGERLEVSTALERSARPALVRVGSAQGLVQPHGTYEDPLRLFWRGLAANRSPSASAIGMASLLRIVDLVASLTPSSATCR